jgi:membrane-bound ClpP family serine protease
LGVVKTRWPIKFSKEWWLWLANGAFLFGAITYVALFISGRSFSFTEFLVFVVLGSVVGDLLMAAAFEIAAPSSITLRPGEKSHSDDSLSDEALVMSGFENTINGHIEANGERWNARIASGNSAFLKPGDRVSIIDREGLCLLVEIKNDA